jgi:hypothetical protein
VLLRAAGDAGLRPVPEGFADRGYTEHGTLIPRDQPGALLSTAEEVGAQAAGWAGETPLWYYILREADVREAGSRLGPVGARIVGEVLVGLLDLDPTSVRHAPKDWAPKASLIELLTGIDQVAA